MNRSHPDIQIDFEKKSMSKRKQMVTYYITLQFYFLIDVYKSISESYIVYINKYFNYI